MPFARHGRIRLYYELDGPENAPALVLVRGFARSSAYWLDLRHNLARRFRLLLLDNRGVGRSDTPRPPYSTTSMADDVVAAMDASGIPRAHVFGLSMGGMIAQWVALRHPQRVERLVLAATSPGGRGARAVPLRARLSLLRSGAMPFERAIRYTAPWVLAPEFRARRPDILDTWAALAATEPPTFAGLAGQILAVARHDAWEDLPQIRARTLVVTGDADRLIPPVNSHRMAGRLPRSALHVFDGAGHDFPTELPEETASVVEDFLLGP
jgi:3-oxoadipate enol-lactonase